MHSEPAQVRGILYRNWTDLISLDSARTSLVRFLQSFLCHFIEIFISNERWDEWCNILFLINRTGWWKFLP